MTDSKGETAGWSSSTGGANKPQNTRQLALFPAKENQELLEDFVPKVEAEIKKVKAEGVLVQIGEEKMQATCKEADLSMADGKMVTSLTRLGGAYWDNLLESRGGIMVNGAPREFSESSQCTP